MLQMFFHYVGSNWADALVTEIEKQSMHVFLLSYNFINQASMSSHMSHKTFLHLITASRYSVLTREQKLNAYISDGKRKKSTCC